MRWLAVQYLWYLVAAVLLGVLVGWLVWGRRLKRLVSVVSEQRTEIAGLRDRVATVERERDAAADERDHARRELDELAARLADVEAAAAAARGSADSAAAEAERGRTELAAARADAEAARADAEAARADAAAARAETAVAPEGPEVAVPAALTAAAFAAVARSDATAEGGREPGPGPDVIDLRVPAEGDDDLEHVEGIGPAIADALRAGGVRSFAKLANTGEAELRALVSAAGLSLAPSLPSWSAQAALLAHGDEEGFTALTGWLVAGVPPTDGSPLPSSVRLRRHGSRLDESTVALLATPPEGPPDDLTRVEGIGPKMNAALQAAGIRTFARLSRATEAELRAAIEAAGLKFAPSITTWARQAGFLARGDEAGFAEYAAHLVAGRDTEAS